MTANADAVRLFHEALAADQAGDLNQSFQCLIGSIAQDPSLAGAWNNLGMTLNKMRKYSASVAAFYRSHTLAPEQVLPLANYAWSLQLAGDSEKALKIVNALVLPKDPDNAAHWTNLSQVKLTLGDREGALEAAEKAVSLGDTRQEAKLALGLAQLRLGQYQEGLKHYEARMQCNPILSLLLKYPYPLWRGEDIRDKRLFIPCEQGIGDSIMFLAFIIQAAERAKAIVVHVHHQVLSFYQRNLFKYRNVKVFPTPTELPADIDIFCPSLSLPVALQLSDEETMQAMQIMKYAPVHFGHLPKKNDKEINIGICWAGDPNHDNDRYRSANLESFMVLAEIKNARLFALQMGKHQGDLDDLAAHGTIKNLAPYIRDVNDTAAIMAQHLDIIVTIDSAPAHIAGAIGIKTYLLHGNRSVDWRWQTGDGTAPWYPKTQMLRQKKDETWNNVLKRVKVMIENETKTS